MRMTCAGFFLFAVTVRGVAFAPGQVEDDSTRVAGVTVVGNRAIEEGELLRALEMRRGSHSESGMVGRDSARIIALYREEGYLHTVVTPRVARHQPGNSPQMVFAILEGKPSVMRFVSVEGDSTVSSSDILAAMHLHRGDRYISRLVEEGIRSILRNFDRRGFPLAKVVVSSVSFEEEDEQYAVDLAFQVEEGRPIRIGELRIEGNKATKDYVIARETRLETSGAYRSDVPERVRRRLERLHLFSSVALPELYLADSNSAGLLIRVSEGNSNTFDGLLGYMPPARTGDQGYVTGLVNIQFRNLFGTARRLSARWYRESNVSQETELRYAEPWVASAPVNVQLGFHQRKQDSTYVKTRFDLEPELILTEELTAGISFSQENVVPTEGSGASPVPRSVTTTIGASIRYDSRDDPVTPTDGLLYSTQYHTGRKSVSGPGGSDASTQRIVFDLLFYSTVVPRQVLAVEAHARDFSGSNLDVSDMFRLGGATSLRGYREGQFLGSRLAWVNGEYRFLIGGRSYLSAFTDFGYVVVPDRPSMGLNGSEQSKAGYGVGLRVDTAVGLININLALGEGDSFGTAKLHFRLVNEF